MSEETPFIGRRIVVWGVTGSGKTTLSQQLGEALGLKRIELDALFWKAGWTGIPDDEFRAKLTKEIAEASAGWVVDGSYSRVSDIYLAEADTLVWLHLPWHLSFRRLFWRTMSRAWKRESLYYEGGPKESWRLSFFDSNSILWWSIRHHRSTTRSRRERIAALPAHVRVHELKSAREVAAFREQVEASRRAPVSQS